jgi:hypothetical protein
MPSLTEQLTNAAADLYYPSESEYPLEPFVWKREAKQAKDSSKETETAKEETSKKKKKDKVEDKTEAVSKSSSTDKTESSSAPATADDVLKFGGYKAETKIKETTLVDFFERTTKIEDWFGDEEKAIAQKFSDLQKLVESNLQNIKVFRVGEIEIDVYVVGVDADGNFAGLKTMVVET